ncbi:MAG: tyrosine-type recombinase/integrase [bacterium]
MATALHLVRQQTRSLELDARDPVQIYLSSLDSHHSRRTMQSKLRTVQRLLDLKTLDPKSLCVLTLAARAALQEAGASFKTINTTLCAMKGVAKEAWRLGILTAEERERVRDIASMRGHRLPSGRAHTPKEIAAVMDACGRDRSPTGARDAAIVAMLYNLGLRRAECAALDLDDYSPTNDTMRIHGKGNKERMGYVVDKGATNALGDWLALRSLKPGPLFCPVTREGKVIVRRLTDQSIYNALLKRARAAGVANLTPHNLRRSSATDLLDRGADINVVKELLGHSSLDTTKIYDRRGDPAQRRAASLLKLPYQNQRQPELPWEK